MASGAKKSKTVTSYKAFDHDLYCRGFQYEVGKTYKVEGKIVACENGFHACENPLDVWGYYPIIDVNGKLTRYAEVEQSGEQDDNGDKIASAEITIKAELTLPDFIKRAVTRIIDLTKGKNDKDVIGSSGDGARIGSSGYGARIGSSGDGARIGSSGDGAQIGSSGDGARIGSSGDGARIGSSGDGAQIGSSGYGARIGSSGYGARIGSSGYGARIGSSGDGARIGSSGNGARIGSSGYGARIGSSGKDAVIASAGINVTASGEVGTWISLAEFDDNYKCVGFATGCIGKDGLKPNTPYRAKNGKLVEAN